MDRKGLILVSARYGPTVKYSQDRTKTFLNRLRDELGFPLVYTDRSDVPKDVDVVIVHSQRTYTNSMMELADLDKRIKMIGIIGDPHSLGYNFPGNIIKMLNRYDLILSGTDKFFRKVYPEYVYKFKFFPMYFAPDERYTNLEICKEPLMRCLLTGNLKPSWLYPFRNYIYAHRKSSGRIDVLPHPGTFLKGIKKRGADRYFLGDRYAKKVNSYFCNIVTSGFNHGVVAKFMEIPAAGSLMLCNEAPDLAKMGILANEHYVPITEANVLKQVDTCLDNPLEYEEMRMLCTEFVRAKHGINNRIQELKDYVASI